MIDQKKYVPLLKCKAGEFIALNKLPDNLKDEIVPIVDIVPIGYKKSFESHINSSIGYVQSWDTQRLIYIDGYMLQNKDELIGRKRYLEYVFDELRKSKQNVIPVISNISNPEYVKQVNKIIEKDKRGVCLRIFVDREININDEIESILPRINLRINQIDLLIDLRSLEVLTVKEIYEWQKIILTNLIQKSKWRSLVITGGNFPINLTELKADQIHLIQRKHWISWSQLFRDKNIDRYPSYSDYGISHPKMSEVEGIPNASASIRYTHENEYFVYRGKGTRQHGYEQFYEIAEALVNSSAYFGIEHCYGDEFIHRCGIEKKVKGRLLDWRAVGTNHHITVVVNQLRQFWRDFNATRTS
jgi:hypothetical protein